MRKFIPLVMCVISFALSCVLFHWLHGKVYNELNPMAIIPMLLTAAMAVMSVVGVADEAFKLR